MPGRPGKKRRKSKDEPKKWGKLSRKEVKMTCSICKKIGHNKAMCAKYGRGSTSQPTSQGNSSQQSCSQTGVRTQSSQQSSVCADTTAVPRTTQTAVRLDLIMHLHFLIDLQSTMGGPSHSTFVTTYTQLHNQVNQVLFQADTECVPRPSQNRVQVGTGRGLGRKKLMQRGPHLLPKVIVLLVNRHLYQSQETIRFAFICIGGNPGASSEKILHGPTKLKSASPTNIDIGFKPRGLKWKGKDAVGTSQLQQMKTNRKNWK
ncbi:hypothetical protein H5410_058190 [Solanum commersonii]|uniref:Uncharacterized protein n=1 Tax=Solanum commersonii TaxID=4109 RepID=A0A9J5WST9_SOLCO|nr:hypothetical protein H5410_058190 [Solanum commersonii]